MLRTCLQTASKSIQSRNQDTRIHRKDGKQLPPSGCLNVLLQALLVSANWQAAAAAVVLSPDLLMVLLWILALRMLRAGLLYNVTM